MKSINTISLVQAYDSLQASEYEAYKKHYGIDIKNNEVDDLKQLVIKIYEVLQYVNIFNDFYVGYKIQHISKEFDLLRFGDNYILNIELKKSVQQHLNYIKTQFTFNVIHKHKNDNRN